MPYRTCLFCRRTRDKASLVRFVCANGMLRVDLSGTAPGRGAYLCRRTACLEGAFNKSKDAFSRALRQKVSVDGQEFIEELIKEIGA
ncbi:MAG: YlxR family protein [Thermodesulfobacteriota bacterium]